MQEHCRKYYKALESWIPWLSQAENKLDLLRPESFSRRDVDKHLRDLSNFRNEVRVGAEYSFRNEGTSVLYFVFLSPKVWKKSGEFEHVRSLCETFVSSADVDREIVKQELAAVKARWDKLNNGEEPFLFSV